MLDYKKHPHKLKHILSLKEFIMPKNPSNATRSRPFVCKGVNCNKRFIYKRSKTSHEITCSKLTQNTQPYTCSLCQTNFKNKSDQDKHEKIKHENPILYACPFCDTYRNTYNTYFSPYLSNIIRHMKNLHADELTSDLSNATLKLLVRLVTVNPSHTSDSSQHAASSGSAPQLETSVTQTPPISTQHDSRMSVSRLLN
jgi:hypothetical protein